MLHMRLVVDVGQSLSTLSLSLSLSLHLLLLLSFSRKLGFLEFIRIHSPVSTILRDTATITSSIFLPPLRASKARPEVYVEREPRPILARVLPLFYITEIN